MIRSKIRLKYEQNLNIVVENKYSYSYFKVMLRQMLFSPSIYFGIIISIAISVVIPISIINVSEESIFANLLNAKEIRVDSTSSQEEISASLNSLAEILAYGSVSQISSFSSLMTPLIICLPVLLFMNKLILKLLRSTRALVYLSTPVRKNFLIFIPLIITFVLSSITFILSEVTRVGATTEAFQNQNQLSAEAFANEISSENDRIDALNQVSALIQIPKIKEDTFILQFLVDSSNRVMSNVKDIVFLSVGWSYLYNVLLILMIMATTLIFGLNYKPLATIGAILGIFIGTMFIYVTIYRPLNRIPELSDENKQLIYQVSSGILVGTYSGFLGMASLTQAGFKTNVNIFENKSSFSLYDSYLFKEDGINPKVGEMYSREPYIPTYVIFIIMGLVTFILFLVSFIIWRKKSVF